MAYQWDCLDYESEVERPRPTFAALAPTIERNPVTGIPEPHFDPKDRAPRVYSGILIIITMVSLMNRNIRKKFKNRNKMSRAMQNAMALKYFAF